MASPPITGGRRSLTDRRGDPRRRRILLVRSAPVADDVPYRFERIAELEVLRWPGLEGLSAVVTTRDGGVSTGAYQSLNLGLHVGDDPGRVIENRARAARTVGLGIDDLVFCNQVHGRVVAEVTGADRGRGARSVETAVGGADALVTADRTVGLVVMVADCVPIVLHDPVAGVLACVHAGWGGTVARVGEAAVEAMRALGARPDRILAGMGPAIAPADYQVGQDVADAAQAAFGALTDDLVVPDGQGRYHFDLWSANVATLTASGVLEGHIHRADIATSDPRFFSDRAVRPCGRFAALATLAAPGQ